MGKGVKEYVEYIIWIRFKSWVVFIKDKCSFSFKGTWKKEYEYGMCKLEIIIKCKSKKRMELSEIVNVLVAELESERNVKEVQK